MPVRIRTMARRIVLLGFLVVIGVGASLAYAKFANSGSAVARVSDCVRAAGPHSGAVAATTRREALSRAVDRYGKRFPSSYSGARWYRAERRPRLAIGFTNDLKRHLADLRKLAGDPGLILVCKTTRSAATLARITARIPHRGLREAGSLGWDRVLVHLRADQAQLANDLIARFGDALVVQLGLQPYRDIDRRRLLHFPPPPKCPWLPVAASSSLSAHLHLDTDVLTAGADLSGTVDVRNDGVVNAPLMTGSPQLTYVLVPGTNTVVATQYDGAIAGVGIGGPVPPGGSIPIRVIGATATCTAGAPPALSPGVYEVLVAVPIDELHPQRGAILSNRVTVTLQ